MNMQVLKYLENNPLEKLNEEFGIIIKDYKPHTRTIVLNYDQIFSRNKFHPIVRECRNLILTDISGKWEVSSQSFYRFFNLFEQGDKDNSFRFSYAEEKLDGCLHATTKILLPNGKYKDISKIINDDSITHVMGYNHKTNKIEPTKIINRAATGIKNNWMIISVRNYISDSKLSISNIRITSNHKIFDGEKYKCAKEFKVNDTIIAAENCLNSIQKQVILGSLLGDSSISYNGPNSANIQGVHKEDHKEYVELKRHILGDLSSKTDHTKISGYGSNMISYDSISNNEFFRIRQEWYPNKIKKVPINLDWLTPLAFAFWYMDDGSLCHNHNQNDRINLATNAFSHEECERLCVRLKTIFPGISTTIYQSKGWNIRINYNDGLAIHNLWNLIKDYFPICMQYKLPKEYRSNKKSLLLNNDFKSEIKNLKSTIISIKTDVSKDSIIQNSKQGYDLQTETNNFYTRGMLVHNSIISLYYDKELHRYQFATRGTAYAEATLPMGGTFYELCEKAIKENPSWQLWQKPNGNEYPNKVDQIFGQHKLLTLIFELISPENRVVTKYYKPELILIGGRKTNFEELDSDTLDKIALELNLRRPYKLHFNSLQEVMSYVGEMEPEEEGFVLVRPYGEYPNHERMKVKNLKYLDIAHTRNGGVLTPLRVVKMILRGDYEEYIKYFPEDLPKAGPYYEAYESLIKELEEIWNNHKHITDKKTFAISIMSKTNVQAPLFSLFNKKISSIKEGINNMLPQSLAEILSKRVKTE